MLARRLKLVIFAPEKQKTNHKKEYNEENDFDADDVAGGNIRQCEGREDAGGDHHPADALREL